MAKVDWIILCERAIVEAQANTVSIVCILENISLAGAPPADATGVGIPFRFFVVQQWMRTKPQISEIVTGRFVLKGPNGKQIGHMEYMVDLRKTPKARVISQIPAFPYVGLGVYKVIVQAKSGSAWRTLRDAEFTVTAGTAAVNVTPLLPARRKRLNS